MIYRDKYIIYFHESSKNYYITDIDDVNIMDYEYDENVNKYISYIPKDIWYTYFYKNKYYMSNLEEDPFYKMIGVDSANYSPVAYEVNIITIDEMAPHARLLLDKYINIDNIIKGL